MPACDLSSLTNGRSDCKFSIAGVSDRIYIFDIADFGDSIPEPANTGTYSASAFADVSFYAIDIKSDSGQVTSSKSEDGISRTVKASATINYAFEKFQPIDTAISFMNVGVLVPIDSTTAYVVMSPWKRTTYTSDYDSGTTYDSDHGFTISFSAAGLLYACPTVDISTLNLSSINTQWNRNNQYSGITARRVDILCSESSVAMGSTLQFKAYTSPSGANVIWSVSDISLASISTTGLLTPKAAGTITVFATSGSVRASRIITIS